MHSAPFQTYIPEVIYIVSRMLLKEFQVAVVAVSPTVNASLTSQPVFLYSEI